jgi:hypothetical protein
MAIQYPINIETDRFTVYDTNTNKPVLDGNGKPKTNVKWASSDNTQMIPNLSSHIKWLIEVKETRPSFDSATQKINRLPVSYDVSAETATVQSFEVVALTQEEIDAKLPPHFTSTTTSIKYSVSEASQNAFTRMTTLVNEAQMPNEQALVVKDVLGASIGITVEQFHTDMVAYGLHCYELFNYIPPEPEDGDFI